MPAKVFLHGVPDTPQIWSPLLETLNIEPSPQITHIETIISQSGPVDIVAHDWGALIALRMVCLRPDLIRTWTVISAVPHPDDLWHSTARQWQTPIMSEALMLFTTKKRIAAILHDTGLTLEMAKHEAAALGRDMKKSILGLYRSAKRLGTEWYPDFEKLPPNGLIIWGEEDRFGPVKMGQVFAERYDLPFIPVKNTGHWPFVQKPDVIADHLLNHWVEQ